VASFSARSEILLGAAKAFGDHGYGNTTVQHVLKAAGVSRRTFYRFFKNKDDVFQQLADAASMLFLENIRTASNLGKTPEEKLANCVEVYLRAPQTAGPIFHVLLAESSRPGSVIGDHRRVIIEALVDMLSEGVREHQQRDVDPLMVRGLIAALESISQHVFMQTDAGEKEIQRAKAAMMHLVVSALDMPAA